MKAEKLRYGRVEQIVSKAPVKPPKYAPGDMVLTPTGPGMVERCRRGKLRETADDLDGDFTFDYEGGVYARCQYGFYAVKKKNALGRNDVAFYHESELERATWML